MNRITRPLLLLGAAAALALAPAAVARADTANASITEDAWYAPPPTCALPLGCGPTDAIPPTSRYPAGTLHIGATGGVEDARSYLKLDLGAIPSDGTVDGGTLTIPIGPSSDGTSSPETAQIAACLATGPFEAATGSSAPPPAVDCNTTAPAKYSAGSPAVLTVDLSPFLTKWAAGAANNGIALMPAPGGSPGATWHVAFSAHDRTGSAVPPPGA